MGNPDRTTANGVGGGGGGSQLSSFEKLTDKLNHLSNLPRPTQIEPRSDAKEAKFMYKFEPVEVDALRIEDIEKEVIDVICSNTYNIGDLETSLS